MDETARGRRRFPTDAKRRRQDALRRAQGRCARRPSRPRCPAARRSCAPASSSAPAIPTGRFTHWPSRLAEGGEVLAPGDGSTPVAVHRRARSRGVRRARRRERHDRHVQRLGPEQRHADARTVLDACNQRRDRQQGEDRRGSTRLPRQAGRPRLVRHADVARPQRRVRRLRHAVERARDREGPDVPPDSPRPRRTRSPGSQTVPEADRPKLASTGISRDREAEGDAPR